MPETVATSAKAPPIATNPRPISSQLYEVNELNASAKSPRLCTAMQRLELPNNPEIPANFPKAPIMVATSPSALPIATNPWPISLQDILANASKDATKSLRPDITAFNAPAENTLEKPANLVTAVRAIPTSDKAPPIAVKPRPISSHDIFAKDSNAVAKVLSPLTMIRIPTEPKTDDSPPVLPSTDAAPTTSVKAPPIATNPCAISSQENVTNLVMASDNILQLSAKARIAKLEVMLTLTPFNAFTAKHNAVSPAAALKMPLPISGRDNAPILLIESAKIFTDSAIRIIPAPALTSPFDPLAFRVLVTLSSVALSILNRMPIVVTDFVSEETSSSEIVFKDAAKIPIDAAISSRVWALIPAVKFSIASCKDENNSESPVLTPFFFVPENKLATNSFTAFVAPERFLVASTIFLPVKIANTAPMASMIPLKVMFSLDHPMILPINSPTLEMACPTVFPIPPKMLVRPLPPVKLEMKFEITEFKDERVDSKLVRSKSLFNAVRKSPILAVASKSIFPRSEKPPVPRSFATELATDKRTFLTIPNTEKTPEKVRCNLSAVLSLIASFAVNFSNAEVIFVRRTAVIGGKILSNASLIGRITDSTASQIFQIDLIRLVRPPASFQLCSNSFRASPPLANTSYIRFANSVHKSVASSALPNISSKVFIQPVLTASLTESIASVKVRAFWAASNAFRENSSKFIPSVFTASPTEMPPFSATS